ncbi:TBCC domain-containing protein 1-like [Panicum miliaceum]|uniref:TBCC domain-containing protein 1-like n=1 Tax=Panicum miliaceum TaxID=4540 RepID=A0A3L6RD92_PANMI|nr:TBCC domain-containing protein 1-like [Panicum miliaceum]
MVDGEESSTKRRRKLQPTRAHGRSVPARHRGARDLLPDHLRPERPHRHHHYIWGALGLAEGQACTGGHAGGHHGARGGTSDPLRAGGAHAREADPRDLLLFLYIQFYKRFVPHGHRDSPAVVDVWHPPSFGGGGEREDQGRTAVSEGKGRSTGTTPVGRSSGGGGQVRAEGMEEALLPRQWRWWRRSGSGWSEELKTVETQALVPIPGAPLLHDSGAAIVAAPGSACGHGRRMKKSRGEEKKGRRKGMTCGAVCK